MDAVRPALLDEIRPVVQDEERAVRLARTTERVGRAHELVVGKLFIAQLDDVDAAAKRRVEQRRGIVAVGARLEHEIEA